MGQKQKTEKKKKERLNVGNNNGQLRIANATSGGARKAAWANFNHLTVQYCDLGLTVSAFLFQIITFI